MLWERICKCFLEEVTLSRDLSVKQEIDDVCCRWMESKDVIPPKGTTGTQTQTSKTV